MFLYKRLFRFALGKLYNKDYNISREIQLFIFIVIYLFFDNNQHYFYFIHFLILLYFLLFILYFINICIQNNIKISDVIVACFLFSHLYNLISEKGITYITIFLFICNLITLVILHDGKKIEKKASENLCKRIISYVITLLYNPKQVTILLLYVVFAVMFRNLIYKDLNLFTMSDLVSTFNYIPCTVYIITSTTIPLNLSFKLLISLVINSIQKHTNYDNYIKYTSLYKQSKSSIDSKFFIKFIYFIFILSVIKFSFLYVLIPCFIMDLNVYDIFEIHSTMYFKDLIRSNCLPNTSVKTNHTCIVGEGTSNLESTNHSDTTKYCPIGKHIISLHAKSFKNVNLEWVLATSQFTCFQICRTPAVDNKGFIIPNNNMLKLDSPNHHFFVYDLALKLAKSISQETVTRIRSLHRHGFSTFAFKEFNIDVTYGNLEKYFSKKELITLQHIFLSNPKYFTTIRYKDGQLVSGSLVCSQDIGFSVVNLINLLGLDKAYSTATLNKYKLPYPGSEASYNNPNIFRYSNFTNGTSKKNYKGYDQETWDVINSWRNSSTN